MAQNDEPEEQANASEPAASGSADVIEPVPVAIPEPEPETIPEEEASDLGSPGFNSSHPPPHSETLPQQTNASTFQEGSHDFYQPDTGGLSYPQAVTNDLTAGMDYSAYSNQLGQQQATQSGSAYTQQSQQTSNVAYPDQLSAAPAPASKTVQPVRTAAKATRTKASRSSARRSLPSGTSQTQNGYSNPTPTNTGDGSAWQAANAPASTAQAYTGSSSPRQSRAGRQTVVPLPARAYDASQQEALAAAATLSQAALQKTQPSPAARTVSPFPTPTPAAAQVARAKSRQGQKAQSRTTASPFQQASATQPAAVDTAAVYNPSNSTEPNSVPNYDQYSRYNMAATQSGQASSRGAYDSYPQQTNSNNVSATYSGYGAYSARSQSSNATPLAAPVTENMSASYMKTAAPSTSGWSNSTGHRNTKSFGTDNAAVSAKSTYNAPGLSTQEHPATMQSFNVRPQSTAHASRTSTPTSYNAQQQRTQQPRQQQQPYNSYSAQLHSSSGQQPGQQQQQQQQDWYGFGSGNNANGGYGSGSRGAEYGQPSQHRPAAMNISGNTYQSMGDQELYDIFRGAPAQ